MKYLGVVILSLGLCPQVLPQELPKEKKVPIYRISLVCPHGKTLWVKQQTGTEPVKGTEDGLGNNYAFTMIYRWFPYDEGVAMRPLGYWGNEEKRCFKNDPNPAGGSK